jgi:Flagellar hook-length control protein FliK
MAITITPNLPSVAATVPSAPASAIALQAGQVITAEVLQVLGNDQVQIAIGNQTIEATTQVPLQVGQTLQLQVSQTSNGVGLAIVNQPSTGQAGAGQATSPNPVITLSPSLAASLAANLTTDAVTPANPLTPLETLAVSVAAQTAVAQQTSLAPLFADLNVAVGLPNLPPQVQGAVAQVLAQQTTLDLNLSGEAVQQAFQSSGILLEASLVSGAGAAPGGIPDLKAALIVLRQALTSALPEETVTSGAVTPSSIAASASTPQAAASQAAATTEATTSPGALVSGTPPSEPTASGTIPTPVTANTTQSAPVLTAAVLAETSELLAQAGAVPAAATAESAPQEVLSATPAAPPIAATAPAASSPSSTQAIAQQILELAAGSAPLAPTATSADAVARAAASGAALNLLQEVLQASPVVAASVSNVVLQNSQLLSLLPIVTGTRTAAGVDDADFARTNIPPPPINGALPSAQPVAPATLAAHVPVEAALQHLLDDTDGAIARQTLLQIASLPGQADPSASRLDASAPRWNFEIPFLTPQGTAMAQFEISRDGAGREATSTKATWRARFSLNVEPAGPVHALVSLNGDRTSVKMWAERPSTAAQLRAGVSQLTQALSRAELTPGDIVIRDGAPQQPAAAPAGHFLDRAS